MSKILFVDNQHSMVNMFCEYLRWYGFNVEPIDNSDCVFDLLNNGDYGLLICSEFVEPIDGYRLCSLIRNSENPKVRDIKIIFTAQEDPELDKYIFFNRFKVNFVGRYENLGIWNEKIAFLLNE